MSAGPQTLADVSEATVLARIFPFFPAGPAVPIGPGDDAAVIATGAATVATTDSMVRTRDWLDAWSTAGDVAAKLLTQNLADVAAMGAEPTAVLVSLMADPQTPAAWAVEFARALGEQASAAGVVVAGGDLSSAPEGVLMVSLTALGDLGIREAVLRSGARAGDVVAVCGTLGRSAAGLALLEAGADPAEAGTDPAEAGTDPAEPAAAAEGASGARQACLRHHLRPTAPLAAGPQAALAGATAMIDLSDGLLRDGSRIAAASGMRLALESALLGEDLELLTRAVGDLALECVLAGGEEHSLLATFPGAVPEGWRRLGQVVAGAGVTLDGEPQTARGWDHFGGAGAVG
jgi:thiamine-monophosphate kinase